MRSMMVAESARDVRPLRDGAPQAWKGLQQAVFVRFLRLVGFIVHDARFNFKLWSPSVEEVSGI